jgi:hypothetical protein
MTNEQFEAAHTAWMSYEFDQPILDSDGWTWTTGDRELTRIVYFGTDSDTGPSKRGYFTVVFKTVGSAEVAEVYCNPL